MNSQLDTQILDASNPLIQVSKSPGKQLHAYTEVVVLNAHLDSFLNGLGANHKMRTFGEHITKKE